jgi:hypothetical protein
VTTTQCAALEAIDASLRLAIAERNRRLRAWTHSPNGDSIAKLREAQAELDLKLEERYRAQ